MASSKKLFTLSIIALMIVSVYTALLPAAGASEPTLESKTLSLLSDVIGIKTELYTSRSIQSDNPDLNQTQKQADLYLTSSKSNLRVTCSYIKDTAQLVYISDLEGTLPLKQPDADSVAMAKGLLERYQTYAGDSSYGQFASMLNDVDVGKNLTKHAGNVELEVTADQNRSTYSWTYINGDGVVAEKKSVILLYEGGVFKGFFNNWPLYTIADTASKLSAQQATKLAIEASKGYSYTVVDENGTEIEVSGGFSISPKSLGYAKLIYVNNREQEFARGGDPYGLYLAWLVPLGFDKFYPGSVSGLTVILWADTGEVCGLNRVIVDSGLASPETLEIIAEEEVVFQSVSQQPTMLPVMFAAVAIIGVVSLAACRRVKLANMKLTSPKHWSLLLCMIIMISTLVSIPLAGADTIVTGKSRIYSCLFGKGYENPNADEAERTATAEVCNYVGNASADAGYNTSNQYSNTINTTVISDAGLDEQTYLDTMVFYAGHHSGLNIGFQDTYGGRILAADIYPQTGLHRHFFTFLWVCGQAENPGTGTPMAWTHRDGFSAPYLDSDAFMYSDGRGQCYISFYGYSPMLSTYHHNNTSVIYEYNELGDIGPAKEFIIFFYYFALNQSHSVRDALDLASNSYFQGAPFTLSHLYSGYNTWWPGGDWNATVMPYLSHEGYFPMDFNDEMIANGTAPRDPNRMRVFGDIDMKLSLSSLTVNAYDSSSNPVSADVYIDGKNVGAAGNTFKVTSGAHTVRVESSSNVFHQYTSYGEFENEVSVFVNGAATLTANYYGNPPPQFKLTITANGGTANPGAGEHWYTPQKVAVTAAPDGGHYFDCWRLDGVNIPVPFGQTPTIQVSMSGHHTLEAVFAALPSSYKFVSSIADYGYPVYNPNGMIGPSNDGDYTTIFGSINDNMYGWVSGALNAPASGHIYVYGSGYGPVDVYIIDNYGWNYLSTIQGSSSFGWIDCGTSASTFNYIAFYTGNPTIPTEFSIDSVKVDSTQYTLTISTSGNGYTNPSGNPQYLMNTYANVQAQGYSGSIFHHWLLDGNDAGSNPSINVYMDGPHTLQAVFVPIPPAYVASITGYGDMTYNPNGLIGPEIDGQYATIVGSMNDNMYGWITAALNTPSSGYVYVYGGGYGGVGVYTSTDNYNWEPVGTLWGSGGWVYCGTCGPASYIAFFAPTDGNTMIDIDAVKIVPEPL
jgi:hypothetical protein